MRSTTKDITSDNIVWPGEKSSWNIDSTINRKIPAILMETGLSCCAVKIHDKVDELKKTADGRKKIMPMIEHYYGNQYKGMSVTEFIRLHNNKPIEDVYCFRVGSYSDMTPETVQGFMEELGVPTEATIEVPEADVTDWKEITETLGPDEVEKIKAEMTGKFVKIDKPLSYGYVYLERLYHQPQYSGKVVSDLEDVSGRGKQPIAGRGLYRKNGGQKISEIVKSVSETLKLLEPSRNQQYNIDPNSYGERNLYKNPDPKYERWYSNLIKKSIGRQLDPNEYYEKHHILPKSLGGTDDESNLVYLTYKEHACAHLILQSIYPLNTKLIFAVRAMMMVGRGKRSEFKLFSIREVAYYKKLSYEARKGKKMPPGMGQKISIANKNRVYKNSTKKNILH